jgi:hypothetical protein
MATKLKLHPEPVRLTAVQREYLAELPPIEFTDTDTDNPMFQQWRKMIDVCSNPSNPLWPRFGGRSPHEVTVIRKWYNFANFVADMGDSFEPDWGKPKHLRRNYIHRRNLKAGFNPKNAYWATYAESIPSWLVTSHTVDVFGTPMTLRDASKWTQDHEGEKFPDGRTYRLRVRELDSQDRLVPVYKEIDEVQSISLLEMRKRYRAGKDLFRPTRPYGKRGDEAREAAAWKAIEQKNSHIAEMAKAKGMSVTRFLATHYDDGTPIVRVDGSKLEDHLKVDVSL